MAPWLTPKPLSCGFGKTDGKERVNGSVGMRPRIGTLIWMALNSAAFQTGNYPTKTKSSPCIILKKSTGISMERRFIWKPFFLQGGRQPSGYKVIQDTRHLYSILKMEKSADYIKAKPVECLFAWCEGIFPDELILHITGCGWNHSLLLSSNPTIYQWGSFE